MKLSRKKTQRQDQQSANNVFYHSRHNPKSANAYIFMRETALCSFFYLKMFQFVRNKNYNEGSHNVHSNEQKDVKTIMFFLKPSSEHRQ